MLAAKTTSVAQPLARRSVRVNAIFSTPKVAAAPAAPKGKTAKGSRTPSTIAPEAPASRGSLGKLIPSWNPRLGFTKANELFVGRMAMLGFAAALIGEVTTGQGILGQLGYETGLMSWEIDAALISLIGFNLIAAFFPASGKFVREDEEALKTRPDGPLQDARISLLEPRKFFGVTDFGFTKENELFVGRVAQLGFAAALIGEIKTGKGPLEQLGIETGLPILDAEFGILALIAFFLFAAINEGTGRFVANDEEF